MEKTAPKKALKRAIPVEVRGTHYSSLSDAWRARVVPSFTKLREFAVGRKDTTEIEKDHRASPITINGVLYDSVTKAFGETGITINRINYAARKTKSRTIEIKVSTDVKGRDSIPLTLNGVLYETVVKACQVTGISFSTLNKKLRNNPTRVVDYEVNPNCTPITINGTLFASRSEASIETGICMTSLYVLRKAHGDVITTKLDKRKDVDGSDR